MSELRQKLFAIKKRLDWIIIGENLEDELIPPKTTQDGLHLLAQDINDIADGNGTLKDIQGESK